MDPRRAATRLGSEALAQARGLWPAGLVRWRYVARIEEPGDSPDRGAGLRALAARAVRARQAPRRHERSAAIRACMDELCRRRSFEAIATGQVSSVRRRRRSPVRGRMDSMTREIGVLLAL